MNKLIKPVAISAFLCTAFSANASTADIENSAQAEFGTTSPAVLEQAIFEAAQNFYHGDFQQLSRVLEQSTENDILYTGAGASLVSSSRAFHL